MVKWRKELQSGQYFDLLAKGFFDNRPEDLEPEIGDLDFYIDALRELSTCRPGGLDLQAIPFTAINEYSRIYEIDDEDFNPIIRMLDDYYLELMAQDKPAPAKKGKDAAGNNRN